MSFLSTRRGLLASGAALLSGCGRHGDIHLFLASLVYPVPDWYTPHLLPYPTVFHPYLGSGSALDSAELPERYFSDALLHPDDTSIFLLESEKWGEQAASLLRYDLARGQLSRYAFPVEVHGYLHRELALSPLGNEIVMRRIKEPDQLEYELKWWETYKDSKEWKEPYRRNQLKWKESYKDNVIVIMKTDGTDYRVVPLAPGIKGRPALSMDGKKLAFWRAEIDEKNLRGAGTGWRYHGGEPKLTGFYPCEYDFKTGEESIFAEGVRETHFYGRTQYIGKNEILASSTDQSGIDAWVKIFHKDATVTPLFQEVHKASHAAADRFGNIYACSNPIGAIFKRQPNGTIEQWPWPASREDVASLPWNKRICENPYHYNDGNYTHPLGSPPYNVWHSLTPFSDGARLLVLYEPIRFRNLDVASFAILDTVKHEWHRFALPPLESAKPILVSFRR